ncbi:hypothetical protein LJC61_07780 [Ruminococcaceae bacterium OttesenSCG-928-A16]|nr:hypothetical protein [Ruminococcaceae bacterium OttesenSCG-928-A16]
MKKKIWRPAVLVLLLYGVAVLLYVGTCLFGFMQVNSLAAKGKLQTQPLTLQNFTQNSIIVLEDEAGKQRFVSTDPDPQLIYATGAPFNVGRVTFTATPHKPGGEIVLYYAQNENYAETGFSEKNKLWARQAPSGEWFFDLNGKQVTALRLDPDTTGGVVWVVNSIVLNAPKPTTAYFVPDAFAIFWLVAVPPFAAAVVLLLRQLALDGKKLAKNDTPNTEASTD